VESLKNIMEGCARQDRRCQKLLYERFYAYALKIAFRYIYRYEKAKDVVNDGFVKLFRSFGQFRDSDPQHADRVLMGWIRKIIINTSIDELRKKDMICEIGGIPDYVWDGYDNSLPSDHLLLYKELMTHIKELPPTYRVVFNMFVIDGCTHEEIADALGISIGTSKSNLFRARALLQKVIKEKEEVKSWIL
jgi:RNA polymerase sigma factor (sigma-70 family)